MPRHDETRYFDHAPRDLFALVADIESYPEFLPWCRAARIRERRDNVVIADLVVGFGPFRERFTSRVAFDEPNGIDVEYTDGPLRYLNNRWRFAPEGDGCMVDFHVDFEFRSRVLRRLIGVVFGEALSRMTRAFEERADALHGRRPPPAPLDAEPGHA